MEGCLLMHCICKNTCTTVEFLKNYVTTKKHKDAFNNGFFRCRKCEVYIKGVNYCPCCGTRLATAPRNAKCKRQFKKNVGRY